MRTCIILLGLILALGSSRICAESAAGVKWNAPEGWKSEAAMPIDLLQQLLDADSRQSGFDRVAELPRALRNFQCVRALELQSSVVHRSERVFG